MINRTIDVKDVKRTDSKTTMSLPHFQSRISAGFPSPADDYEEGKLDLNTYVITNPPATFFVRVSGDSMINAGIFPDDVLVVDRSIEPTNGNIVIAVLNGELTVKRLHRSLDESVSLLPENPKYPPILLQDGMDFSIWGVVTTVVHKV